jgi:predicted DNA-binding transcriptional regulator AlpA
MKENCPMPAHDPSVKAAVSVSEMCELCSISRSRWYELVDAGVFPAPVVLPPIKRPVYDRSLIEKCLQIKQTGIGLSGTPVVFNRKLKKVWATKAKAKPASNDKATDPLIEPILEAVKALGLTTTLQAVTDAVAASYPTGIAEQDQGDVIRNVFLFLQGNRR